MAEYTDMFWRERDPEVQDELMSVVELEVFRELLMLFNMLFEPTKMTVTS